MYDPSTGRFINEDPIRDGLNWYVYCGGNPVNYVDYTGLKKEGTYFGMYAGSSRDVTNLQKRLNLLGYVGQNGKPLDVDGVFGANTDYAIRTFQQKNGLVVDGLVGDATWGALGLSFDVVNEGLPIGPSSYNPDNDTVTDEGWIISAVAVGGAAAYKLGVALVAKIVSSVVSTAPTGFSTFNQLKEYLGSPGSGNHWHHIVEQCQIVKSGFSENIIHATNNIYAVSADVHAKITGYYGSIQAFTNGMKVRDWLAGQSFEKQYQFGINVLKQFGGMK